MWSASNYAVISPGDSPSVCTGLKIIPLFEWIKSFKRPTYPLAVYVDCLCFVWKRWSKHLFIASRLVLYKIDYNDLWSVNKVSHFVGDILEKWIRVCLIDIIKKKHYYPYNSTSKYPSKRLILIRNIIPVLFSNSFIIIELCFPN